MAQATWKFGILKRLSKRGMKGNLLRFYKSFLANRTFKVLVGSTLSDLFILENSIPQGSVISVTLFLIAINGIADGIPNEKMLFVDDLRIIVRGTNLHL